MQQNRFLLIAEVAASLPTKTHYHTYKIPSIYSNQKPSGEIKRQLDFLFPTPFSSVEEIFYLILGWVALFSVVAKMSSQIGGTTFNVTDLGVSLKLNETLQCRDKAIPPYFDAKFILVGGIGTIVATIALVGNFLLIAAFLREKFSINKLYLLCLASSDSVMSICYVLLFTVQVLYNKYRLVSLSVIWHLYTRQIFVLAEIAQFCMYYFMIAASLERCLTLKFPGKAAKLCNKTVARLLVVALMLTGIALKLSRYFEIQIHYNRNCTGTFAAYSIRPTKLLKDPIYVQVHVLYLTHISQVYIH